MWTGRGLGRAGRGWCRLGRRSASIRSMPASRPAAPQPICPIEGSHGSGGPDAARACEAGGVAACCRAMACGGLCGSVGALGDEVCVQEALKDLTKAASLSPDYECFHQRGIVYHKMARPPPWPPTRRARKRARAGGISWEARAALAGDPRGPRLALAGPCVRVPCLPGFRARAFRVWAFRVWAGPFAYGPFAYGPFAYGLGLSRTGLPRMGRHSLVKPRAPACWSSVGAAGSSRRAAAQVRRGAAGSRGAAGRAGVVARAPEIATGQRWRQAGCTV